MDARQLCILFFLSVAFLSGQQNAENIGNLPSVVTESSGLIFYNGKLVTLNDSGNTPQLFEIDTVSLAITRTITLENAENVDWEDLTQDAGFIYIGDFGNNLGNRTDLAVYKISKAAFDASDSVTAEKIAFSYEDQTDFSGGQTSDWDAEAFVVYQGQLLIFTKQWQSNGTVAYEIPLTPGTYSAKNLGSFPVGGLVTGATFNDISQALFLIGYSPQLSPFVLRMDGPPSPFAFNGTEQKMNLPIGFAQVEGITHVDINTYYVTSEQFINNNPPVALEAGLFRFTTDDAPEEEENPEEPPAEEEPEENPAGEDITDRLIIFRQQGSRVVQYELISDRELFGRAIFDAAGRILSHSHASEIENSSMDLSTYGTAVYYLTFYLQGRTISKPFILN